MPHIPSHLGPFDIGPFTPRPPSGPEPITPVRPPTDPRTGLPFPPDDPFESPFLDFFETTELGRRAQFQAALPQRQTAGQQRFNPFDFEQIMNNFLRRLSTQVSTGQVPNATFGGELASQFSTPGQQQRRRARAPVFQSGLGTAGLVGPLRRLFNQ